MYSPKDNVPSLFWLASVLIGETNISKVSHAFRTLISEHPLVLREKVFFLVLRQKGGDLIQSYDKSPYTNRNVKRASDNTNNATKKFG